MPTIETPITDKRKYRTVKLKNELEVLIIQHFDISVTARAAVSLSVNTGSFNDPASIPGLAHFCEHLLFMGSRKYPSENAYSNYLARGAGISNAYTTGELTNFHFEINDSHLEGMLDIFSQFFVSPLFLKSCQDREVRSVDSEHKKNMGIDHRRFWQLSRIMANPAHPFSRFTTGDLQTLSKIPEFEGIDVRKELIKYYTEYYSANRMKIVISSSLPLDQLQSMAIKYFSVIVNKNLMSKPSYSAIPMFTPVQLQTILKTVPIMATRLVRLDFPVSDKASNYKVKPYKYFVYLIGHEGPGSVYSFLKSKNWVTSLYASANDLAKGYGMFQIEVGLTVEGIRQYEGVILALFQYINFVANETRIQKWIFDEVQKMSLNEFTFKQSSANLFTDVANIADSFLLDGYPLEHLISGPYLLYEYNAEIIWKYGQQLNWRNFKVLLIAPELSNVCISIEPYFKNEYVYSRLSSIFIGRIKGYKNSNAHFALPEPNKFIPVNFDLIIDTFKEKTVSIHHKTSLSLIKHDNSMKLWYKCDCFNTPMGCVFVEFINPSAHMTPYSSVLTELFSELANEHLNQLAYSAIISGLNSQVEFSARGFQIKIHGFNDKITVLLQIALKALTTLEINDNSFSLIKEKLLKKYDGIQMDMPFIQMMCMTPYILDEKQWSPEEMSLELKQVTKEKLQTFIPMLTERCSLEILVHGNFTKREAIKIGTLVVYSTNPVTIPQSLQIDRRSYILPRGKSFVYSVDTAGHRNLSNAVQLYLQIGPINNIAIRALTGLLDQFLRNPAFYHLRSKEQLGYIVHSVPTYSRAMVGFSITVQTEKNSDFVENRIESFLKRMEYKLEKLSNEEFIACVNGFISENKIKAQNLFEETNRIWAKFQNNFYDFTKESDECTFAKGIQKAEFIQFYKHYISPTSFRRAKLSIHLKSKTKMNELELFVDGIGSFLEANDISNLIISRMEIYDLTKDCIKINTQAVDDERDIQIDFDAASQKIYAVLIDKGYTTEFVINLMSEGMQILASIVGDVNSKNEIQRSIETVEKPARRVILLQPLEVAQKISLSFELNGITDKIISTIEIIEMVLQNWDEAGKKTIAEPFKASLIGILVQRRFSVKKSREIVEQALSSITVTAEVSQDVSNIAVNRSIRGSEGLRQLASRESLEPKTAEEGLRKFSEVIINFFTNESDISISKLPIDDIIVLAQKSVRNNSMDFNSFMRKLGFYLIKKGVKITKLQVLIAEKGHILQKMLESEDESKENKSPDTDPISKSGEKTLNEPELFTKAFHSFLVARCSCEPSFIEESSLLAIALSTSKKNKQGSITIEDKKFFKKLIKFLSKLGLPKEIIKGLQREGIPSSAFFVEVSRARSIVHGLSSVAAVSNCVNNEDVVSVSSGEDASGVELFVQGIIVFLETKKIASLVQEDELMDIASKIRRNETHDIQPTLFAEALSAYLILKGCDPSFVNTIMKEGLDLLSAMLDKNDYDEDDGILDYGVSNLPITNLVKFRSELRLSIAAYPSKALEAYEEKASKT